MARPPVMFTRSEIDVMNHYRNEGLSWDVISWRISESRGADRKRGDERLAAMVSHEHCRKACQKTGSSKNPHSAEAETRQRTREQLDTRWTQPQTTPTGGRE